MYKLENLPIARQDMFGYCWVHIKWIKKTTAAIKLAKAFIASLEKISKFPYSHAVYIPSKPLKKEYRRVDVKNIMFSIGLKSVQKKVVVARVISGKRDYEKTL